MTHPKKRLKTYPQKVIKRTETVSKMDQLSVAETFPKTFKFINSQKWIPGASQDPKNIQKASKRHPKAIQKASKSHPKGIGKASKLIQIISHCNQHSKKPNAKTCKEPCTPSDLTKRRVTSRCGGVASAFSINSTLPLSLFFKNHTRDFTNSPKGFLWKPAAGSQSPAASSGRGD